MAFDHISMPKDLRPLNVCVTVEESRIAAPTSAGRNIDGFFASAPHESGSPCSVPVFYPATGSDAAFPGLGYGNVAPVPGVSMWRPQIPVPIGHAGVSPVVGYCYGPNISNKVPTNAVVQVGSGIVASNSCGPSLGNRISRNGSDQVSANQVSVGSGHSAMPMNKGAGNGNEQLNDTSSLGRRSSGNNQSDDGGDDSVSRKKFKFLCSFGGKILPRPSDGMLRYVGGQTRIISVRKDVKFKEFVQKMANAYGQPVVIKYQLPDEDLDALVSVSCPDDLDNMMDEYEKLAERSSDGSAKLRVFLFSPLELDPSGVVQFGDLNDSGHKYVEAVNGIMEGVPCGIVRKGSLTSVGSTQNSDMSGTEAVDGVVSGQGDISGPPSTSIFSPKGDPVSCEATPRMVGTDHNVALHTDPFAVPLGGPLNKNGPPQTVLPLISVTEVEPEKAVPLNAPKLQLGLDCHQQGVEVPISVTQSPNYMVPRQEVINQTDYVHLPPQMGFPNPNLAGNAGMMFKHQQIPNNTAAFVPHQFIPAMHMTMAPPVSQAGLRSHMVQQVIQPPQTRLDGYPDDSSFGARPIKLPVDQSHSVYQAHGLSLAGGAYYWPQVSQSDHGLFSDGSVARQQVIIPEKVRGLDDCHMCQKALPHAHSDLLVQDQRNGSASLMPYMNTIYHNLCPEDLGLVNGVQVTTAVSEGMFDQGAGVQELDHMDHQFGTPRSEAAVFSSCIDIQCENDKNGVQKINILNKHVVPPPYSAMDFVGDMNSAYGVFVAAVPQSVPEDTSQLHVLPSQCQVKQESVINKHVNSDIQQIGGLKIQASEPLSAEAPKEHHGKVLPGLAKEDAVDSEHKRGVDGVIDTLQVSPSEKNIIDGQNKTTLDRPRDDLLYRQALHGGNVLLDNTVNESQMIFDNNLVKSSETLLSSSEIPYVINTRPGESTIIAQSVVVHGNAMPYPESKVIGQHLDSDWKDDGSRLQQKVVHGDAESVPSNSSTQASISPSSRASDTQNPSNTLFSNQNPWDLLPDNHFRPPRPSKIQMKKEVIGGIDPFGENWLGNREMNPWGQKQGEVLQPLSILDKDFCPDQSQSTKGCAEELIKQELQAVAEGVAASVFHANSSYDSSSRINESDYVANNDRDVSGGAIEKQHRAKFEGIKNKLPERMNFGFPVSGGIGSLQIIKNSDLEELRELGSGTFGTVYHGKWRGTDVAIKRINDRCFAGKPSEQERMIDDFWNEAIKLADLHHPNVVAFYGIVLDGPGGSVATVTEYMVNGSLRNALQKNERNLDKRKRLLIAMDVAFGMEYLHGKNIVHFDLKSDNLLVNLRDPHRPICKVGDLGLSKVKCQTLISGSVRGTLPWMAPELLNGSSRLVSEKVDVFSFGIVMWELLTGEEPYADLHYGAIIGGIVSNTLRPAVPECCDPEWRSLMERCWSPEPSERPSFTEIADALRGMAPKPQKGQGSPP